MDLMPWVITLFTVVAVYFLDKWEHKYVTSLFDWVPAILLAYVIPAVISAVTGLDFSSHEIHQFSKGYFIPLAIIAVMSSLSLGQLKAIGWKPILLFVSGSFWIALFPVLIAFLFFNQDLVSELFVDQEYWKGLPPIVGSWIGGSTSQLVLKELVDCPENIFLTILILDSILVNIWTILMFQGIKQSKRLNHYLGITSSMKPSAISNREGRFMHPLLSFCVLLLAVVACNLLLDSFVLKIIVLSILGLLFSNMLKRWNFDVALKLGSILILIVMSVLGLKLKFDLFTIEFSLLGFLIIWLVGHFVFMLVIAKFLNVNVAWVPIASMANVGGIATAPAVTAAYEKKWMPHAIVLAILSMATGTFWGMLTIYLLQIVLL